MRLIKRFFFIFLAFATLRANAEDAKQACVEPTAGQQIAFCKRLAVQTSDGLIRDLFAQNLRDYQTNDRALLEKAGLPAAAPDFIKAHKAWTAFRNASCTAEYKYAGSGTLRDIEYLDCLLVFNSKRAEELRSK